MMHRLSRFRTQHCDMVSTSLTGTPFKILKRNASHIVGKFMTCKLSTVVTGVEKYPVLAATNVTCIPLTVSWLEGERKSMT